MAKKPFLDKEVLKAQLKAIEENENKTKDILANVLPKARRDMMDGLRTLGECGIEDDYVSDLMMLVSRYKGEAIPLTLFRMVLPDHERLAEARKILRDANCIEETKDKAAVSIKFVKDYTASVGALASD